MLRDKINESEAFVVLGTENYVRSLRNPDDPEHHMITEQVIIARHLCKPIILLIDKFMDKEDKDYLKDYFKGFNVIEEYPLSLMDNASIKEAAIKLIELLRREQ